MRALVTGIDGFVGGYLAAELSTHGYKVYGTTIGPDHNSVRHIDVTDPSSVTAVLREVRPECVFHLAGLTSVKESWSRPALTMNVNRDGTRNLFQALVDLSLSPRLLITSSAEVYGQPQSLPISETHPTAPLNPYAESKFAQEQVTTSFPGVQTIITRSFPHIGPGQSPSFVTSDFAQQIVQVERGQSTTVRVGNLSAERDFTDVRDVVRAYRLLVELERPAAIYNVCSGVSHRIQEILDRLLAMSSVPNIPVVQDNRRMRPSDIPVLRGDHTKLTAATGWQPRIGLQESLGAIYQSYAAA